LTTEFYIFFWDELCDTLVHCFNTAYQSGKLSISQRQGVITLVPKKKQKKEYLENWRPITLLNVDYKIATKAIAKRMENVLQNIINPNQTGYVKGRYIGENIRLISDIMEYTTKNEQAGIAMFLDFRKAFDTIEWSFIEKALVLFDFGPDLIRWVKTFYTDISSCTINNGFASIFFTLERGVRQGCPLSGLLFVIGIEALSIAVNNDQRIKGIKLYDNEVKLSQYADDTTCFLYDETSAKHLLEVIDSFGKASGLKLNKNKTEALWLGTKRFSKDKPLECK